LSHINSTHIHIHKERHMAVSGLLRAARTAAVARAGQARAAVGKVATGGGNRSAAAKKAVETMRQRGTGIFAKGRSAGQRVKTKLKAAGHGAKMESNNFKMKDAARRGDVKAVGRHARLSTVHAYKMNKLIKSSRQDRFAGTNTAMRATQRRAHKTGKF
jgi:hypothetical protein